MPIWYEHPTDYPDFTEADTPVPDAPFLLSGTVVDLSMVLHWSTVSGATGYKIKYGTSPGVHTTTLDVGNVSTYVLTGLLVNQLYYFVVVAYDLTGDSTPSNELALMITQTVVPPVDLQDLIDYYVNLLIVQYRILPRAKATIRCLVNRALCDGLPLQLQTAFDLDSASGAQLTIIGRIVGVGRNIYGLDLNHEFFNFTRWDGIPASHGFNRWTTPDDTFLISRWRTNSFYALTDFELRALIHLKIIYNNKYESLGFVKNALYEVFGGAIDVVDNANCTIDYNLYQPYHNVAVACGFLGNILPKPAGVGITINQL